MHKSIWKFPLKIEDQQTIRLPRASRILTIQMQDGRPMLWFEVYSREPLEERVIFCFGTGHHIPTWFDDYIATVQDGPFVWHFYDGGHTL